MRKGLWEGEGDHTSQGVKILWLIPFVGEKSHSYVDYLPTHLQKEL